MRHVVQRDKGSSKAKVTLPDVVPDGAEFPVTVDGRRYAATWHRGPGILVFKDERGVERQLRVRGRNVQRFEGDAETEVRAEVSHGPKVHTVFAQVGFDLPGQAARGTATRDQVVRSQITGKILKVLVKAGETVTQGQALLTIEAMKMENRVFAPAAGKIESVAAKEGDAVQTGKELLRIVP